MKQHEHAAANDNRPAEFDAMIMAYVPGLRRLARRMTRDRASADDLVTDTIILALSKWRKHRPADGAWNWLVWTMRSVMSSRKQAMNAAMRTGTVVSIDTVGPLSVSGAQQERAELSEAVHRLRHIRNGEVVLRVAAGETLSEIARDRGVSRERVRQIHAAALRKLEAA